MGAELSPLASVSNITAACRWNEFKTGFELGELVLYLGLQHWANSQDLDDVILLVPDILRREEHGLGSIIGANSLHDKVDESLVHEPVVFVVAKKHS